VLRNRQSTEVRFMARMTRSTKKSGTVSEKFKTEVEVKAAWLIENVIKPRHVLPPDPDARFNYVSDIRGKWYQGNYYFIAIYTCPGPNALSPTFESRFARLKSLGRERFALDAMRHNDEWMNIFPSLSLDECLKAIEEDPWFHP
jgi:hypothetical protein